MSPVETALAVLVLLVTPGPTNSLLALGGAERGWGRALRLIPAELAGYLATVLPLCLVGAGLLDRLPAARTALTLVAAAWVLWLAVAMWRLPPPGAPPAAAVTPRRVFVTTLLNPKALVFGLLLLPAATWEALGRNLLTFVVLLVGVAAAWAGLGAAVGRGAGLGPLWRRGAALWLGGLSAYLAGRLALG